MNCVNIIKATTGLYHVTIILLTLRTRFKFQDSVRTTFRRLPLSLLSAGELQSGPTCIT